MKKKNIIHGFVYLVAALPWAIGLFSLSDVFLTIEYYFVTSFVIIYWILDEYMERKKCSVPVLARYIGYDRERSGKKCIPVFRYTFDGEEIEQQSILAYPEKVSRRLFAEKEEYTVFVNPKAPQRCVDKRWFPLAQTVVLIVFCLLLLVCGIHAFIDL